MATMTASINAPHYYTCCMVQNLCFLINRCRYLFWYHIAYYQRSSNRQATIESNTSFTTYSNLMAWQWCFSKNYNLHTLYGDLSKSILVWWLRPFPLKITRSAPSAMISTSFTSPPQPVCDECKENIAALRKIKTYYSVFYQLVMNSFFIWVSPMISTCFTLPPQPVCDKSNEIVAV